MKIHQVLNNNVAIVIDVNGNETIYMGKGISFKKKAGDLLNEELVTKVFKLDNTSIREKFSALSKEVSPSSILIAEYAITKAEDMFGKKLNENIHISLADHIEFAINRFNRGLALKNDLLWDIKNMYPNEYSIGALVIKKIEQSEEIKLPDDEAAFVAMHILSAELDEEIAGVVNITKIVSDCIQIINYHFHLNLDTKSLSYHRLIVHLKFFAQRLIQKKMYIGEDDTIYSVVVSKYKYAFDCAQRIAHYVINTYTAIPTNEEMLYLTVHIERIVRESCTSTPFDSNSDSF